jgi:hypothetical protein
MLAFEEEVSFEAFAGWCPSHRAVRCAHDAGSRTVARAIRPPLALAREPLPAVTAGTSIKTKQLEREVQAQPPRGARNELGPSLMRYQDLACRGCLVIRRSRIPSRLPVEDHR